MLKPGIYRHYKGGEYRVHFIAKEEATGCVVVVYEALYDNQFSKYFTRPLEEFIEVIEQNGITQTRFTFFRDN